MGTLVLMEATLKYQPDNFAVLTLARNPGWGQCMVGSLTGAVSSQRVTEEFKGPLSMVGNHASSARAQEGLTASLIRQADAKAGSSDPVVPCGRAIA